MTMRGQALDTRPDHEQKRVALNYLHEAWTEARTDVIIDDLPREEKLYP